VPVDRVVAGVHDPAREPAVERRARGVEHALERLSQSIARAASAQNASGSRSDRAKVSS
jgi:hypothetical protein